MRRIMLRELRDTASLKAALRRGEAVELCERRRVLGVIRPPEDPLTVRWPDFQALGEAIFGGRMLTGADILVESRRRS